MTPVLAGRPSSLSISPIPPPLLHHHTLDLPASISIPDEHASHPGDRHINAHALSQLQHRSCMNNGFHAPAHPNIRVESSTPPFFPPGDYNAGWQDSWNAGAAPNFTDWQQQQQQHLQFNHQMSMGGPVAPIQRPLKRARSHQRTPSASTVASNGPASPYTTNSSFPHIASTEFSPNSPAHFSDPTLFPKTTQTPQQLSADPLFLNAGYIPNPALPSYNPHLAIQGSGFHGAREDFPPAFAHSSRHSMSSQENGSPATPYSGGLEQSDNRNMAAQNDLRQVNSNPSLFRTESQAYQDELYNPSPVHQAPAVANKRRSDYLSPHQNSVHELVERANMQRSNSPLSAVSRERSPFREGSPLAPPGGWRSPAPAAVGTAAGMRQQQRERAAEAEYAQHRPALQREPTKTISPKDALLEYSEPEQPSLFQDSVPAGYKQHNGGSDNWMPNFSYQPGSTFGALTAPGTNQQQMTNFRAASNDGFGDQSSNYNNWLPMPQNTQNQTQFQNPPLQPNTFTAPKHEYSDPNPTFPANLTSMESSMSENPPASDQGYSPPQRPADVRAGTGTYTCTYHGCVQRFDSHQNLQRHKRDQHRIHQQNRETSQELSEGHSGSPGSTESPGPDTLDTSGMTSAAILARNSQAGPHKCTRINPSTNKPCNSIFSRPYDLTRHEDTIHNNRKTKVRCPTCHEEKSFSRNDALTRHMRVVHPEVDTFGKRPRRD